MKKNTKILLGVLAVAVVGVGAYIFSTGGLQGRMERFVDWQPAKKISYVESVPLCLKPEEWEKKYPMPKPEGDSGDSGDSGEAVVGTESSTPVSGSNSTVIKIPEIGISSGGDTVTKTKEEKYTPEVINYVECSCARKGFKYITQDSQGKDVTNICVVWDPLKCVDPDFLCPEGTKIDFPVVNKLCKAKKNKNCFSALKPDYTSKEDAMCKNLISEYKAPVCPPPDECEKLASWMAAGTFTFNVKKYGLDENIGSVCSWMHPDIWNKK